MATRIPIGKDSNGGGPGGPGGPGGVAAGGGPGGLGFEDRQKKIWEDMEADMERRRREWEEEIEKMRKEFFMLRPDANAEAAAARGVNVPGVEGPPMAQPPPPPIAPAAGGGTAGERLGPPSRGRLLETSAAPGGIRDDSHGTVALDDKGNPVFKVLFNLQEYRPEEVSVKMDADKIRVSARHEAQQGGSSLSREYNREVTIPADLDPMTLQCTLGPDGVLSVEAPLPQQTDGPSSTPLSVRAGSPASSSGAPALPQQQPQQQQQQPQQQQQQQPQQQQSSSSSSSSYQSLYQVPGMEPVVPVPGFKPVSAAFLNSAPGRSPASHPMAPPPAQPPLPTAMPAMQPPSFREASNDSPLSGAFGQLSPPFQSLANHHPPAPSYSPPPSQPPLKANGSGGRIGSPVVSSDPGKFKLEVDIEDFKPEELTVKTQDRRVVVCARREEKVGNRSSTRELSREHTIPDSVDPLTIKAFFTDGGKLVIEAPYKDAGGLVAQVTGR